jgi:hypothetical protein
VVGGEVGRGGGGGGGGVGGGGGGGGGGICCLSRCFASVTQGGQAVITLALLTRDDASLSASVSPDAVALKEQALAEGAMIFRVSNPDENAAAVSAQAACRKVLKLVEECRVAVKQPILDYGRAIDATAKAFVEELRLEEARIAKHIGDYKTAEAAKIRAAEAARQAELNEIERRRQEELAKAETHDQRDVVNARADEEAKAAAPAVVQVRADGQRLRDEWEITQINEWALAKAHPELVRRIEFDMPKVKAALDLFDGKLPGVIAQKVVKSSVRLPVGRPVIVEAR